MAGLGRGRKLCSVIDQVPGKNLNDLQHQLFEVADDYTNESIEALCSKFSQRSNDGLSSDFNPNQSKNGHLADSVQFEDIDTSELPESHHGSSCFGTSRQSKNARKIKIGPDKTVNAHDDSHYKYQSKSNEHTPNEMPSRRFPTNKSLACNHQHESSFKSMGRGQKLRMVADSLPSPKRTLQNEIARACGDDYSNQSIEKLIEKLNKENGETS